MPYITFAIYAEDPTVLFQPMQNTRIPPFTPKHQHKKCWMNMQPQRADSEISARHLLHGAHKPQRFDQLAVPPSRSSRFPTMLQILKLALQRLNPSPAATSRDSVSSTSHVCPPDGYGRSDSPFKRHAILLQNLIKTRYCFSRRKVFRMQTIWHFGYLDPAPQAMALRSTRRCSFGIKFTCLPPARRNRLH